MHNHKKTQKIFCIGIGGIGLSALAQWHHDLGADVSGSNNESSMITEMLVNKNIDVVIGQDISMIPEDADLIIYSKAIPDADSGFSQEISQKFKNSAAIQSYPEALGDVTEKYTTIAVTGTHGKTTTTAMLSEILITAQKDPSVIIGSFMKQLNNSNYRTGSGELLVIEACEYAESFLNYSPQHIILTNIDDDHLDYYGSLENIQKAFREFIKKVPNDGVVVTDVTHPKISPILEDLNCQIIDYTQWMDRVGLLELPISGEYNIANAAAAYALAEYLNIAQKDIEQSLENHQGTWRRFEYMGEYGEKTPVYTDYAHHPTELRAFMKAFTEKYSNNVLFIFEPHLHARTREHFDDFVDIFSQNDPNIILLPVYAARDAGESTITRELYEKAKANRGNTEKIAHFESFDGVLAHVREQGEDFDAIATVGAGNVHILAQDIVRLSKKSD